MSPDDTWVQAIGWISTLTLVPSLGHQTWKQWKERTAKGVSLSLYLGSLISSIGFTVYSWLVDNPVFVFANGLLIVNNVFGLYVQLRFRKKDERAERTNPTS